MAARDELDYEVVAIGAGVAGICQIKRPADLGVNVAVPEAAPDLGGSWYQNRYPGHEHGKVRYFFYNGGTPKYVKRITEVREQDYAGITLSTGPDSQDNASKQTAA